MFDIQHYPSFIAAILIFQMIPGPGTLAILGASARGGLGAGMGVVFGTLCGDFVYMLAAMQWLGIAYLCWIGIKLLRAPPAEDAAEEGARSGAGFYFRRGFAVALTNPKAIMFFLAFFPLFMRPGAGALTLVSMMLHVTLIGFGLKLALDHK